MNTVAIIMPAYNAANTIELAIKSVLAQDFRDWALFVIDDASTDETYKIVASLARIDCRINLYRNESNIGSVCSRNRALRASAQFEYISFLDADDSWCPSKLRIQVSEMERRGWLASCSAYNVFKNGEFKFVRTPPKEITLPMMEKYNRVGCLTFMYKNIRCEPFQMDGNPLGDDHRFWMKIMQEYNCLIHGLDDVLANYNISSQSLSGNKIKMLKNTWNRYRVDLKLNVFQSSLYIVEYICVNLSVRILRGGTRKMDVDA